MKTIIADMRQALDALQSIREPDAAELRVMGYSLLDDLVGLDWRWDADHARETAELLMWLAEGNRWGDEIAAVSTRLLQLATVPAIPPGTTIH